MLGMSRPPKGYATMEEFLRTRYPHAHTIVDISWRGRMPEFQFRPGLEREWGDGARDQRPHVIDGINYSEPFVACSCGWATNAATPASLEDAWDIHRGLDPAYVAQRTAVPLSAQATDEEVRDFLRSVRSY